MATAGPRWALMLDHPARTNWPWAWLWAALLLGCDAVAPASAAAVAQSSAPAARETAPTMPLGELVEPGPGEAEFAGVVEQRLAAGSYTYLAVRVGAELRWVATMGPGREAGQRVHVRSMGTRTDFRSRRLDRTFAELVFGIVDDAA